MKVNYQGNRDAKIVLLQIIGEHELPFIEEELPHIKAITQSGTVNSFAQISSDILAEV